MLFSYFFISYQGAGSVLIPIAAIMFAPRHQSLLQSCPSRIFSSSMIFRYRIFSVVGPGCRVIIYLNKVGQVKFHSTQIFVIRCEVHTDDFPFHFCPDVFPRLWFEWPRQTYLFGNWHLWVHFHEGGLH